MRTGTTRDGPARLEMVRRRFDRWRQTRGGRSRIPEKLWALAVQAAERYGLYPTVRALGLDYYSLKRRLEAACRESAGRATALRCQRDRIASTEVRAVAGETAAQFIELAPLAPAGIPECILELENRHGSKMRIQLKGLPAPDLTALSRSFWGLESCDGESRRRQT